MTWALTIAAKAVLQARGCLPLALTAQYWLRQYGVPTELRIGAMRDASGQLQAHAWIEQRGQILIGGPPSSLDQYTPLQ